MQLKVLTTTWPSGGLRPVTGKNEKKPVHSKNRAQPMAVRLIKMYVDQVN